jgi:alanine racemase
MMKDAFYRPTWVEISLDALRDNITGFQKTLPESIAIMAVVKADAYGHGAVRVSKEAIACGVNYLGVAFLDEALELRNAGITAPIFVLGYTPPEGLAIALEQDITINVYSREVLDALKALGESGADEEKTADICRDGIGEGAGAGVSASASARTDSFSRKLKIHIKLDTGMGRLGLHSERDAIAFIDEALALPGVEVEGLFTHYAKADETDKTYTLEQYRRFERVVNHFRGQNVAFRYLHTGNSAAAIDLPELTYNMVRLGISMYGMYPSNEVNEGKFALKPVLSLKTGIVNLKTLPPNSGVSYGTIYHTKRDEQIATLPIGYADGYSRMLTGKAEALIAGRRVPVVGTICMDQCMIDVTGIDSVKPGDEIVLIGEQAGERITVEDIAKKLGTINYEITCMISHRVAKVYISGGKRVELVNLLMRHRY